MLDVSEGQQLRLLVIFPRGRFYWRAVIGILGAVGFALVAITVWNIQSPFDMGLGILLFILAAAAGGLAAYVLVGHEEVALNGPEVVWSRRLWRFAVKTAAPTATIREMVVCPRRYGWWYAPNNAGAWLEISFAGGASWRIASGLNRETAELEWLSEYLRSGIDLARLT